MQGKTARRSTNTAFQRCSHRAKHKLRCRGEDFKLSDDMKEMFESVGSKLIMRSETSLTVLKGGAAPESW
jgi:hypothetical protein